MTAEFNWWLLLLGLVVGGGLTWLVLAETRRREQDLEATELAEEAEWLEARLAEEGRPLPADAIERVVQLHRAYLAIEPPSDSPEEEWLPDELEGEARVSDEPWPSERAGLADEHEPVPALPPPPSTPDEGAIRHEVRGG